jgi:hypothetical protein
MIHLEQGQIVPDSTNLRVLVPTGDYNDNDLIECYGADDPTLAACSFQAQYIKYGGLVYKFNEPQALGEEILKTDPTSTHSAASYVRMTKELLAQMNAGSLQPQSLNQVQATEQANLDQATASSTAATASSTSTVIDSSPAPIAPLTNIPVIDPATSTPPTIDTSTSTTTPNLASPVVDTSVSSTTASTTADISASTFLTDH